MEPSATAAAPAAAIGVAATTGSAQPITGNEQRRLADQVATLTFTNIPADVLAAAHDCVLDTLASGIAGASEDAVRLVGAAIADETGPCMALDGTRRAPRAAALINGTSCHVLDFDDWLAAAGLHPTAPLLPSVLAAAEASPGPRPPDGRRVLTAFVAGFEAQARIGASLAPAHYDAGFHPTATVGVFGAAAGAAHLFGADGGHVNNALSLAATSAAGLRVVFGTMAKPWHAGRAAEGGLLAARLATTGFTAPTRALTNPEGLAGSLGQGCDPTPLTVPFSERWYLREVLLKRHAACFGTHAAIDALTELRRDLDLDKVDEVELTVAELLRTVCSIPAPRTPLEAKFSLTFTAALALRDGRCAREDFTAERVSDPTLAALAARVRVRYRADLPAQTTRVRIRLTDGRERTAEVDSTAIMPPQCRRSTARDKFRSLVPPMLGKPTTDALLAAVESLPGERELSTLTDLLSRPRDHHSP